MKFRGSFVAVVVAVAGLLTVVSSETVAAVGQDGGVLVPAENKEGFGEYQGAPGKPAGANSFGHGQKDGPGESGTRAMESAKTPGPSQQSTTSRSTGTTPGGKGQTQGPTTAKTPEKSTGAASGTPKPTAKPSGVSLPTVQTPGTEESVQTSTTKPDKDDDKKEVCFPVLGCFSTGKPWKSALRPVGVPFAPEKIGTTIFFFSRESPNRQTNITLHPTVNLNGAPFDPAKITAVIVHGFASSGNATWMMNMKDVYLKHVNANVMLVDWGKGSNLLNYLQVAGNTRVVGKQLSLFVRYLVEQHGAQPGKFHLIGHSLGAQICSYLAKDVPGIARLTALDPAQPAFEGFDKLIRLDKSDAEFVDVIHTDAKPFIPALGFGMIAPHGHVDFYMNGGFDQPGCLKIPKEELPVITSILDLAKYPVEIIAKIVTCPHSRAYDFLIEAFNETEKCIFWGHKADAGNVIKSVTNTLTQGLFHKEVALSTSCNREDCIPLGFATKKSPLRGSFVVTTAGKAPYCISEPGIPPERKPLVTSHTTTSQSTTAGDATSTSTTTTTTTEADKDKDTPKPKSETLVQKIAKRLNPSKFTKF